MIGGSVLWPQMALSAGGFMPINPSEMKARVVTIDPSSKAQNTVKVTSGGTTKASKFIPLDRDLLAAKYRMRRSDEKPVVRTEKAPSVPQNESSMILSLFDDATAQGMPALKAVGELIKGHEWPVAVSDQRLTSGFGMRADPFTGKPAFHQGIDIAARTGSPVMASADGVVKDVGSHRRLGNFVRIEHGSGVTTQYGHLSQQRVREGQVVRQGQVIGAIGSTGRSTGPHLDYSIRVDGEPINPIGAIEPPSRSQKRLAVDAAR